MSHVTVAGADIFYEQMGNKQPTVVFVHGAGGSSRHWFRQQVALNGVCRTIAVDLPGHGASGGRLLSTVGEFAKFLADFTSSLFLDEFVVVGHSLGGAIALEFALEFPERLRGLILIGTGARLRVKPDILEALGKGEKPFRNAEHLYSASAPADVLEEAFAEIEGIPSEVYFADFKACNTFNRMEDVRKIKIPSLIVVGSEDKMTPVKYSEYLNTQLDNSELTIIECAGHRCMSERPDHVNRLLVDFLAQL
ncbi:alpha/beta fold hydrolase [Paradesulfitobacterium ferrireducens]|uniref:alpha/beta fold hydrolase n=1 Tax=Paradesulfitobacterium ferrireducens TaxID=2816476 RepID=UPI001A8FA773|nr:alpha/beta hydrolase [Paradesulfitobacterium ferrireducens]